MKKALLAALSAIATATISFADTYTWTGDAGTSDYATAGNWNVDGSPATDAPSETDDVVIDGAAVTWDGTHYVPSVLTLQNNASLAIDGEIQFNTINQKIYGGTVTGTALIAAQAADAVLTISDAHLKCSSTRTDYFVFYQQGGSYLNFVDGNSRSASLSYLESLGISDPYATFFSGNAPKIRYNDQLVSQAEFSENFQVATADGYVTISLKSLDGWTVAIPMLGEVANGEVSVTYTATKYSGSSATIVIGCASSDLGDNIANWAGKTTEAATDVADTTTSSKTITLGAGVNYIRVFVTADGTTVASSAVTARNLVYGDYGDLTNVYEYIGTDNDLTKASNWVKDGQATETAPTASSDIRWFGYNAVLSVNGFSAYATDHFVGANITSSNDFDVYSDLVFSNSTITATMFVMKEGTHQFEIAGSTMVQTRTDAGWYGIYFGADYAAFNFVSGQAASFTGKAPAGITADNLYSQHVADKNYILLDGAAIDAESWSEHFKVEMLDNGHVKVSYNPSVDDNRISAVSATSTSTSATIMATIGAQAAGTLVKLAYGTTAPTEADVLSGTAMTVENATATATLTSLTEFTTYYYLVAIVDANSSSILASRAGHFVASNYTHIYDGTSWVAGGEPAWGTDASVLMTGTFSTGEINPENKVLKDAVMTAGTLANGLGPLTLINSTYTNNKQNDLANGVAAYGIYNNSYAVNFTTASGNGVIKHGDAYTCYATEVQCGTVCENLFSTGKMKLNGEVVTQALFESNFTTNAIVTELSDGETILSRLTITYWESVLGGGSSTDWTIQPGARVKLTKNTRVGALNIPDATDVKIDLNGHKLTVSSLTVGGVTMKGEYTSATLSSCLVGDGSLTVAGKGLVIMFR